MEKTAPVIQFEHFSFQYREQKNPTLHDINLSIYPGEKVLLIGPSGSGKSTLAHCINGLIPFRYKGTCRGSLQVGGVETATSSLFSLSQVVGTVLQDPDGQFVALTAGEDISFSLENSLIPLPEMKQRVQAAATVVHMEDFLDQSPYDLSGGQKQRVSMAGVIIDKVQVLLFDEPLANLDPATGKNAVEMIDHVMAQTNATVVIIEHRLEDALHRNVDRVVLIEDGRIIADLPPDELLCGPWLFNSGIREPLYLTALKYAGVSVSPDSHPRHMNTLRLSDGEQEKTRRWFSTAMPAMPKSHEDPIIKIEQLSFGYTPERKALENVSFEIQAGEMTAIVGTNGAGKSTLAKLICGFEKTQKGRVLFRGIDMEGMSIAQRAESVGYVMQNPNQMISKPMIYEEVALGLVSRGRTEAEFRPLVEHVLEICGLHPYRKWPISALSFGQKKRVTIASVLVMEPEMIILDEPTAGQDFRHYTEIMEFLLSLEKQGVTVLMITHDMHLMLEYAKRALVFSEGTLLKDATPAQVLTDADLAFRASLKETSLYTLAAACGIKNSAAFVQHFIDYDREVRRHGNP